MLTTAPSETIRGGLPDDLRCEWVDSLTGVISALARRAGFSVAHADAFGVTWIVRCDAYRPGHDDRVSESIHLSRAGRAAGAVLLFARELPADLLESCRSIVMKAWRCFELEENERSLLAALGSSWEMLGAVYEISGHLHAGQGIDKLLNRAVQRAAALQPGLHAVAWVAEGSWLVPRACGGEAFPEGRPLGDDPVGRACSSARPIVWPSGIAAGERPPELARAAGVVILPLVSRNGPLGALEVWREDEEHVLDSHVVTCLESVAGQVSIAIENEQLYRTSLEHARLRQQVEIGATIQASLLLDQPANNFAGLDIASLTLPSQQVDGDFWDFIRQDRQRLDVLVGDVMGKSVSAALLGVAAKTQFIRAIAGLASELEGERRPAAVGDIVNRVHAELTRRLIVLETFVTLCYARFELQNRSLELVDCGHPKTLHYRWATGTCRLLAGTNVPLGFSPDECYEPVRFTFGACDVLVFYSDGLTDALDRRGEPFGVERLAGLVTRHAHLPAARLLGAIWTAVADHVGADHVDDDMTCVVVRITDPDTSRERAIRRIELPCRISSLAALREFVGKACRELPGPPVEIDEVHRVVLAAHEAAANVVQHACSEFSETGLEAVVDRLDDRLAVRIYHQGIVPPAEALPDLDFDPGRDRGFGLFLIRHAVDEMHNERDTGGLGCVSLVKQVAAPRRGSTEKKEC